MELTKNNNASLEGLQKLVPSPGLVGCRVMVLTTSPITSPIWPVQKMKGMTIYHHKINQVLTQIAAAVLDLILCLT